MAASTDDTKEPRKSTVIRCMHAVREENTEQAVQLLRPHSADDSESIVLGTTLLIPSSEKTLTHSLAAGYLAHQIDLCLVQQEAVVLKDILRVVFPTHSSPLLQSMSNHHLTQ